MHVCAWEREGVSECVSVCACVQEELLMNRAETRATHTLRARIGEMRLRTSEWGKGARHSKPGAQQRVPHEGWQ